MRYRLVLIFCLLLLTIGFIYAQKSMDNPHRRKVTIGMIGKMASNPVFIASYSGAQLAAKELSTKYHVDVVIDWQTPTVENVEEQATTLRNFSRSKVDGITIACTDANYLTPAIDEVVDKGTPVICFDSDAPKSKRFAYYGADDMEFGRMLMKELARELHETGTIAVLAGNRNALNLQRRLQGIKAELNKHSRISLGQDNIHYNLDIPERSSEVVARAQNANPNIKGWIFITSSTLLINNSLKWKPGEVKVVAGNAVPHELEYVKSGYVQSLVGISCFQLGYKSIELLLEKIIKNTIPNDPLIYSPLTVVNKNNVDEWSLNWKKWSLKEAVNR